MIYTNEQWGKDGDFKAEPFQEIEESIYYYFLEVLPPHNLNNKTDDIAKYHSCFCLGEPNRHIDGLPVYHCFGKYQGKYYYLGLRN